MRLFRRKKKENSIKMSVLMQECYVCAARRVANILSDVINLHVETRNNNHGMAMFIRVNTSKLKGVLIPNFCPILVFFKMVNKTNSVVSGRKH